MPKITPQFKNLQAFEAAGRLGSFKSAADDLNLTPSAISHRITALEEMLSENLFEPQGRGTRLTASGRLYLSSVQKIFDQLLVATDKIKHQGVSGPLTIRLYQTFAHRWLIPRLRSFVEKHPDVELNLVVTQEPMDFSSADTDLVIEYADGPITGFECDFLTGEEIIAVCSPQYQLTTRQISTPKDLLDHTLIHSMFRPEQWDSWLAEANVHTKHSDQNIRVSTRDTVIDAAAAGLGVALAHRPLIDDALRRRRVIALFDFSVPTEYSFYLVTTPERAHLPRVCAFRDWIKNELSFRS